MTPMTKTAYERGIRAALEKYAVHLPEMEKEAFIAKALRALATPIPGTPKLLMAQRGPAALQALEDTIRAKQQQHVHGNIYKALKAMKVDKLYQKMEPLTGSTSEPAIRAQYGDRQIWGMAHAPLQHLLSAPVQYAAGRIPIIGPAASAGVVNVYNTARAGLEKAMGVPGPLPYGSKPTLPASAPAPAPAPQLTEPRFLR